MHRIINFKETAWDFMIRMYLAGSGGRLWGDTSLWSLAVNLDGILVRSLIGVNPVVI